MALFGSDTLEVNIGFFNYSGFTDARIKKSMLDLCGRFSLRLEDVFEGFPTKWDISSGDEIKIWVAGETVMTGYVEKLFPGYEYTERGKGRSWIVIGGRGKTCDLVDCCHTGFQNEWLLTPVSVIISQLCAEFGLSVTTDIASLTAVSSTIPDSFKANEGDSVFELIHKLCNMSGVIPIEDYDGNLKLTNIDTFNIALDIISQGTNVIKGELLQDDSDRYSNYIIKGQGVPGEFKLAFDYISPSGSASDLTVQRYRPLVILDDSPTNSGQCDTRAASESFFRAGLSRARRYTLSGYTQYVSGVWDINMTVAASDKFLDALDIALIAEVEFILENGMAMTEILLVDSETFLPSFFLPVDIKTGFDAGIFPKGWGKVIG